MKNSYKTIDWISFSTKLSPEECIDRLRKSTDENSAKNFLLPKTKYMALFEDNSFELKRYTLGNLGNPFIPFFSGKFNKEKDQTILSGEIIMGGCKNLKSIILIFFVSPLLIAAISFWLEQPWIGIVFVVIPIIFYFYLVSGFNYRDKMLDFLKKHLELQEVK